jgi:hypothetical protein
LGGGLRVAAHFLWSQSVTTLNDYLLDVSALIRDQTFQFNSRNQIIRWINTVRYECALQTGCLAYLISGQSAWGASAQPGVAIPGGMQPGALPNAGPSINGAATNNLQTIPGVERYPYQGFFNPAARAQYAGIKGVVDTITCAVSWDGATKPTLNWMPWEDFQAYCRSITTLNSAYPSVWSVMNDGENGEIYMFPPPTSAGDIEIYASCVPLDLETNDDYEAIPASFAKSVKHGTTALVHMTRGRLAAAQFYEQMSGLKLLTARTAVDRGKSPSFYGDAW